MSMIENAGLRSKIVAALAEATNTTVRELMAGKAEEESITSRIGARLEVALADQGFMDAKIVTWDVPKNTVEPYLGADIYIGIEIVDRGLTKRKGTFVQAKRQQNRDKQSLRKQCEKMQIITKKGSAVWIYKDNGIAAASTNRFLNDGITNLSADAFYEEIMACRLGDMNKAPARVFDNSQALGEWVRKFGASNALSLSIA